MGFLQFPFLSLELWICFRQCILLISVSPTTRPKIQSRLCNSNRLSFEPRTIRTKLPQKTPAVSTMQKGLHNSNNAVKKTGLNFAGTTVSWDLHLSWPHCAVVHGLKQEWPNHSVRKTNTSRASACKHPQAHREGNAQQKMTKEIAYNT